MVSSPIRSLMLLARAALQRLLDSSTPGFTFLREFFAAWLKLDVTTIAAGLTIFGTITGAFRDLQGLALKMYWWFTRFFTAAISIASKDRLNKEILNWIGTQVLERQGTRILTARSEIIETDAWRRHWGTETERNDYFHEKRVPIEYLPTFGTTWFIHSRNLFMVRRVSTSRPISNVPEEYSAAPDGDEPLVVMCLGRSVDPIKRFFDTCRDFADEQREAYITVRASKARYDRESWDTTILRPIRPLATVHFDEALKAELIADIQNYLEPSTRKFYNQRGIPYRRGYLLHGPAGTGKTSLSLALAGYFGLELYLLHLPSVREDNKLERLFTALPPRCIVLLEDIDAVGMSRQRDMANNENEDENEEENEEDNDRRKSSRCTLSGLLNVIDGVASQEGRIVLMTSNMAHKLDFALVRPGRIDKMIFLGHISPRSSELMFLRMYTPDEETLTLPDSSLTLQYGELEKLAKEFGSGIPEETFTPAQLQGYLLNRRTDPRDATREIKTWVAAEQVKIAEAKVKVREGVERRAKKRREAAKKLLMANVKDIDLDVEDALDAMEASEKKKVKRDSKERESTNGEKETREDNIDEKVGDVKVDGDSVKKEETQDTQKDKKAEESKLEKE